MVASPIHVCQCSIKDLPYSFMHHLREALITLHPQVKISNLVCRVHSLEIPDRMVKSSFYVGNCPVLACQRLLRLLGGARLQHVDDHGGGLLDGTVGHIDDRPAVQNEQTPRFQ